LTCCNSQKIKLNPVSEYRTNIPKISNKNEWEKHKSQIVPEVFQNRGKTENIKKSQQLI
jgi:hypothetical protein